VLLVHDAFLAADKLFAKECFASPAELLRPESTLLDDLALKSGGASISSSPKIMAQFQMPQLQLKYTLMIKTDSVK
jgi:hypothetical protein